MIQLTDNDRFWLDRWRVGRQPGVDWLASSPDPARVRAILIKSMDRAGTENVFARLLSDHLHVNRHALYAVSEETTRTRTSSRPR